MSVFTLSKTSRIDASEEKAKSGKIFEKIYRYWRGARAMGLQNWRLRVLSRPQGQNFLQN